MKTLNQNQTKEQKLFKIAQTHFGVTTLAERHQDCLDHHDVSVHAIKAALHDAYRAGCIAQAAKGNK